VLLLIGMVHVAKIRSTPPPNKGAAAVASIVTRSHVLRALADVIRAEADHREGIDPMTIAVGDKLPEATFKVRTPDGLKDVSTAEFTAGRKVVLFAVPGAFTPTCHAKHVPSYLEHLDALKAKGVAEVACVAVNDAFVLDAWAKACGTDGRITFLSDGNGTFTKAVGFDFDGSGFALGTRSKRYSMLVDNGVVKALNVEESPGVMEVSGADRILAAL
jgi:peroxiredoxin